MKAANDDHEFEWLLCLASSFQAYQLGQRAPAVADVSKGLGGWRLTSKRSEIATHFAKKFPSISRAILTLSIRGFLPRLHKHWLGRALSADLFGQLGFPMWGSSCRLHIPRHLLNVYLGYVDFLDHEPLTRRVLTGLLRPGSVVVDVGANIGYYTLLAAGKVGPRGRVHAVECSPKNLMVLSENVRKNKLQNVKIHPFAAASQRGMLTLNVSAVGLSWFGPNSRWPDAPGVSDAVTVPCVPLDEIVQSPVHVVKIDAEGADLDVLKGMKRILSENERVSIIVEWAPPMLVEADKDPLELPRWLQGAGFGRITVLDQLSNKRCSLDEVTERVLSRKLPPEWVCDLFAQR
jgi:FkbM family methyltransferase